MKIVDFPSNTQIVTTICTLLSKCFSIRIEDALARVDDVMSFLIQYRLIMEYSIKAPAEQHPWGKLDESVIIVLTRRSAAPQTDEFQLRLSKTEGGYNTEVIHRMG